MLKGSVPRGALRKLVANCAPNSCKNAGISIGLYIIQKVHRFVANSKVNFRQFYANNAFPVPPVWNFREGCQGVHPNDLRQQAVMDLDKEDPLVRGTSRIYHIPQYGWDFPEDIPEPF